MKILQGWLRVEVVQPGEAWGDLIKAFKYLKTACKKGGEGLLAKYSDRTREMASKGKRVGLDLREERNSLL